VNILVTGGAGFIGTHIALELKRLEHRVVLVDFEDKFTEFHKENFKTCGADISVYEQLEPLERFDIIYHCAAQSCGYISQVRPTADADWNVKGTLNVCRFARRSGVKKIIYTSSMAVYGEGEYSKESDEPKPLSNYGVSKLAGEFYIKMFSQYNIDYTIFRLFNTYGPGQDLKNTRQGIVSVFLAQSINGAKINVTGALSRYRDIIHVSDVVRAMSMALEGMSSETYNLCTNQKTTVKELIDLILLAHDKDAGEFVIENIGRHEGDQHGSVGDNSKLKALGWSPKVNLGDGIRDFYAHSKNIKSRDESWRKLVS